MILSSRLSQHFVSKLLAVGILLESLKLANSQKIQPIRRASILPFVSKMYEIVISEETSNYFEPFLNESLSRFRHNILYLIY